MRPLGDQRGVALLVVMVLLASAAFLAGNQLHTQQRNVKQAAHRANQSQGVLYALAAEEWAMLVLEQDRRNNLTDSFADDWATLPPAIELTEGTMITRMEDAQSRLNLNALSGTGESREVLLRRLKNLLSILGLEQDIAYAIDDWIDPDIEPNGFAGAEDDYYSRLEPGYLAANQQLKHPAELILVKGMSPNEFTTLAELVTAIDATATTNVNTAARETLLAIGLSASQVDTALEERDRRPFESVQDFVSRLGSFDEGFSATGLGVASDYFLLTTRVVIGGVAYAQRSLISRKDAQYKVEWRVRLLPGVKIDA